MQNVLLLNASYEPIRVISLHRAVVMVVQEMADVIESVEGKAFRSPSTEVPWPSVVRLRKYVTIPFDRRVPLNKRNVLNRDKHECAYCVERKADTIDHIHPKSKGGKHAWSNVIASCRKCNNFKDDRTLDELGWSLRFKPLMPTGRHWLLVGLAEREAWGEYLTA